MVFALNNDDEVASLKDGTVIEKQNIVDISSLCPPLCLQDPEIFSRLLPLLWGAPAFTPLWSFSSRRRRVDPGIVSGEHLLSHLMWKQHRKALRYLSPTSHWCFPLAVSSGGDVLGTQCILCCVAWHGRLLNMLEEFTVAFSYPIVEFFCFTCRKKKPVGRCRTAQSSRAQQTGNSRFRLCTFRPSAKSGTALLNVGCIAAKQTFFVGSH